MDQRIGGGSFASGTTTTNPSGIAPRSTSRHRATAGTAHVVTATTGTLVGTTTITTVAPVITATKYLVSTSAFERDRRWNGDDHRAAR